MNYREKEILRVKDEEMYHAVKSMEYFHNELKDYILKVKNVSMLVSEEDKTYEEAAEICCFDLEDYEKTYVAKLAKDYDEVCAVLTKDGGNYVPELNASGSYGINLA